MRRLLALLLLLFSLATVPAVAQTSIHRCIGGDGNPVFTDQPCAALNASPVARSTQSAHESAAPSLAVLCATTGEELQRAVIDAFANRDANRMAGLMLWDGYGQHAAVTDIRALQQIMRYPLLDFAPDADLARESAPASSAEAPAADRFNDPDGAAPSDVAEPPPTNMLVLHTSASDGRGQPRELRFKVTRRFGCLWLRSAD